MTEFQKGRFSVPFMGNAEYRDNWDAIFGKKADVSTEEPKEQELDEQTTEEVLAELTEEAEMLELYGPAIAGHHKLPGGGIRHPRK